MAIDFSPAMLDAARRRFAADSSVAVVAHNLDDPLPELGKFDAVVSCFAIHHVAHERKRALYSEIYEAAECRRRVLQSGARCVSHSEAA